MYRGKAGPNLFSTSSSRGIREFRRAHDRYVSLDIQSIAESRVTQVKKKSVARRCRPIRRRHRAVIDIERSRRVVRIVTPRRSRPLLLPGSRETCDIEGEDFTVDKIPNTRCFNCLCKVNGRDSSPSFSLSLSLSLSLSWNSYPRCYLNYPIGKYAKICV